MLRDWYRYEESYYWPWQLSYSLRALYTATISVPLKAEGAGAQETGWKTDVADLKTREWMVGWNHGKLWLCNQTWTGSTTCASLTDGRQCAWVTRRAQYPSMVCVLNSPSMYLKRIVWGVTQSLSETYIREYRNQQDIHIHHHRFIIGHVLQVGPPCTDWRKKCQWISETQRQQLHTPSMLSRNRLGLGIFTMHIRSNNCRKMSHSHQSPSDVLRVPPGSTEGRGGDRTALVHMRSVESLYQTHGYA